MHVWRILSLVEWKSYIPDLKLTEVSDPKWPVASADCNSGESVKVPFSGSQMKGEESFAAARCIDVTHNWFQIYD
jgi:hypothetical protein